MSEKKALTTEVGKRYRKADKKTKSQILDEFIQTTGYNRKYAIRVLGKKEIQQTLVYAQGKAVKLKPGKKRPANRKGKKIYDEKVIACLRVIWVFFWNKCGKLLAPFMREHIHAIAEHPRFGITPEIRNKLMKISPATIDRALKADKAALRLTGKSLTKPAHALKNRIPIRTFYTSEERKTPGFLQIDTVHHCGQSTSGEYALTLTATDVYSGWLFLCPLLNKAFTWTFDSLKGILHDIPFPFREFHSDNGSEFINNAIEKWCNDPQHPVPFTRSRDHKKNDNCFVEQKNGAAVREYIGYYRLEGPGQRELLASVYRSLEPLLNFFMPTMKLTGKIKTGSKEIRKYDRPRSPYQRLLECPSLPVMAAAELTKRFLLYNPVKLQENINVAIARLREAVGEQN